MSNLEAFSEIMHGQIPTTAERYKSALDDPEVQAHFAMADRVDSMEYLYFLNHLAQQYGLSFDQAEEIYFRLNIREEQADE